MRIFEGCGSREEWYLYQEQRQNSILNGQKLIRVKKRQGNFESQNNLLFKRTWCI